MSCEALECIVSIAGYLGRLSSYHIRCRPFGIARTALTGPLPAGNLNVLWGSRSPLCKLYSSTQLFRRPAYMKLPSGDQQALIQNGGVPFDGLMRAIGFD